MNRAPVSSAPPLSRRTFLRQSGAGLAALSAGSTLLHCASKQRPNIIFILADDLGYNDLGSYGQEKIHTPHLDRMASEGMRFTQHYSGSPVCAPSRCTLLTGLHTGHSYIRDNDEMGERGDVWRDPALEGQRPLLPGTPTVGTMLQKAGYHTAMMGKWGLGGPGSTGHPNLQGFDLFYGYLCQRVAHNYYPSYLWRNQEKILLEGNPGIFAHEKLPAELDPQDPASYIRYSGAQYAPDLMTDEALAYIRQHQRDPFALFLTYTIPHLALQVPEDSLQEYAGNLEEAPYTGNKGYLPQRWPHSAYAAMISRMDGYVGRILMLLRELGLDRDTIVFFTSDNGATFDIGGADTPFFTSNGSLRGFKTQLYEGGIRVPLIARWPGHITPGQISDHISAFWDFLPTLAQLAGTEPSTPTDGISLVPTLLNQRSQKEHDFLYWEYHSRPSQAVRYGDWKALCLDRGKPGEKPLELYDLKNDPGETDDVAAAHPEIVRKITELMAQRTPSPIKKWNF